MPPLGTGIHEGTVVEWLITPGDAVRAGDVAVIVDTAKAAVDIRCPLTGTVRELLVRAGDTVPPGTALARIAAEPARPPFAHPPARALAARLGVDLTTVRGTGRDGLITRADVEHAAARPGIRVSRYARRVAADLGVDLSTVAGSGPGNTVRIADIRAAAAPVVIRNRIAARARREIPHFSLSATIDLRRATAWLRERDRRAADRLAPAALLLKATALAAAEVPALNGHWIDGAFRPGDGVQLGVTVPLPEGGPAVPAIPDADLLPLEELLRRLRDLRGRARSGRLRLPELTSATITVTDLSDQGVEFVHGVLHPPQVALAGFGAGPAAGAPSVTATLALDQRAADASTGARFLRAVDEWLQRPYDL